MVRDAQKPPDQESEKEFQELKADVMRYFEENMAAPLCGDDLVAVLKNPANDKPGEDRYAENVAAYMEKLSPDIRKRTSVMKIVSEMPTKSDKKMLQRLAKEIEKEIRADPLYTIQIAKITLRARNIPFPEELKETVRTKSGEQLQGKGLTVVDLNILFKEGHPMRPTRH